MLILEISKGLSDRVPIVVNDKEEIQTLNRSFKIPKRERAKRL